MLGLALRKMVAKLPRVEISQFLINLLVKGSACLSTIAFFTFEVLACWIENEDDDLCKNTAGEIE